MAVNYTVQDVYNLVCDACMEPWNSGAAPGLSLGIVTLADFYNYLSLTLEDLIQRTSLTWEVWTTQLLFGQSQYQYPEDINQVKLAFVAGNFVDYADLFDLDNWDYQWRSKLDVPLYWHQDGLPPKTIEVAANPNYSGASYVVDITAQPPYGIYGLFNGSTTGQFKSVVTTTGTAVVWVSGALFDVNWNNYYPPPSITIAGTAYPIQSVTSPTALVLDFTAGNQSSVNAQVNIGQDGNLSIVGTKGLSSITFTLDQVIPVLADVICPALSYGILARIWSNDGESKDLQRAAYANARYTEFLNLGAAVAGEMAQIS